MFSMKQKQQIAKEVEKLLLSFDHPEMPDEKPDFVLKVKGMESWSWAEIEPNWTFSDSDNNRPGVNIFNEIIAGDRE